MNHQVSNKAVTIVAFVFSPLLFCSGALGVYFHAAGASGFIVLTAYFMHRNGFSLKQIAIVQLPMILFMVGVIVYNQLFHNIVLVLGMGLSFLIVPAYVLWAKRAQFVPVLVVTILIVLGAYMATGRMLYIWSTKSINQELISLNEIGMKDGLGRDFQFPHDDKLYVIETWSTNCGICFKQMPEFAKLEESFVNEGRVVFRLMYLPLERDTLNQAQKMLAERGVTVQSLYAQQPEAWQQLNIEGVPDIFLIQNGRVLEVRNGRSIKLSSNILLPDIAERIETLLEEL